jgi:hypothetical protein
MASAGVAPGPPGNPSSGEGPLPRGPFFQHRPGWHPALPANRRLGRARCHAGRSPPQDIPRPEKANPPVESEGYPVGFGDRMSAVEESCQSCQKHRLRISRRPSRDSGHRRMKSCRDHPGKQRVSIGWGVFAVPNRGPQDADGAGDRKPHVGGCPAGRQIVGNHDAAAVMCRRNRSGFPLSEMDHELAVRSALDSLQRYRSQNTLVHKI